MANNAREDRLDSSKGIKIFVRSWRPESKPRAVVVICHGVNSHSGQYVWVGEQFLAGGLAAYALDLRGRGQSDGERFYVEDIADYVSDIKATVALAKSRDPGVPVFLLGHSAGFNVPAVVMNSKSPFTLLDVLDGKADTPAIEIGFVPGSKIEFSVGGYLVLQQLLMDITGKPFPDLAKEHVLGPTGMAASTFENPLPKEWEAAAAVGHLADQQPLE